jgi:hypothetical protein
MKRKETTMKKHSYTSIVAATLFGAGLMAVPMAQAQDGDCEDRVTGGGYIVINDGPPPIAFANFGAGGGLHQGELWGYINFVDRDPSTDVRHVTAQNVVGYCIGCVDEDCRRITTPDPGPVGSPPGICLP